MDQPEQNKSLATRRVEMAEFQDDVGGFLRAVREGASFVITAEGEAVAELRPAADTPNVEAETEAKPDPAPEQPRRLVGSMRGQIWMADDWDTWPEGFLEEIEENPIFPPENKGE